MSTNTSEGSPSPVVPNAPKFGTLVPNRIFVGGISATTTEAELSALFSQYGNVKATKIISDRAGVSKGYGFITFETDEEAKRIQKEADNIVLKERKLNIAPAIKKQPFTRVYESCSSSLKCSQGVEASAEGGEEPLQMLWSSPRKCNPLYFPGHCVQSTSHLSPEDVAQTTQNGPVFYVNGVPYTYVYQNGTAVFATADNMYQMPHAQQAAYSPITYPVQAIYIPQPYSYQAAGLPSSVNSSSGGVSGVTSSGPHYVYSSVPSPSPVSCSTPSSAASTSTTSTTMSSCLSSPPTLGEVYSYVPPGFHQYAFAAAPLHSTAYLQQHHHMAPFDYAMPEVNSEQDSSNASVKSNTNTGSVHTNTGSVRPKISPSQGSLPSSPIRGYSNGRAVRLGTSALLPTPSATQDPTRTIRHLQGQQPHLVAKQVNGVTVMAYSSPIMMASPTPQPGSNYESGVMTPPPTPTTPVKPSAISVAESGYKN